LHAYIKTCENYKKIGKTSAVFAKNPFQFTKGRENLESLLGSQNVVFKKNGIGYNPGNVTNVKKLSSFFFSSKIRFLSF